MILCCGEALIDMLPRDVATGDGATQDMLLPVPGGAIFNTAIALGRLGTRTGYLGGLSTDLFGARLAQALAASGVETALAPRSARPTTLAFVALEDGQARYTFYDENSAGRSLSEDDLPDLPDHVAALFFGGISLVSEPAADAFAALCTRAEGRFVMLDPNIRPAFIADAAAYRARLGAMLARADLVKLSDEDLDWLTGGDDPAALMDLSGGASGPAAVVVTRGAQGAEATFATGETCRVAAAPARVVDTVGAGDTFNAGLLAELQARGALSRAALTPETLEAAMTLAARVAAVTVSRAGANPPWRAELA